MRTFEQEVAKQAADAMLRKMRQKEKEQMQGTEKDLRLTLADEGARMHISGARAIDPVLSEVARSYKNPVAAWPALFPPVVVTGRGGRVISFRAEDFAAMELHRAPGSTISRLDVGYTSEKFSLEQRAIEVPLPVEIHEEAAVAGVAMGSVAAIKARRVVDLQIEIAAASLATDATNYSETHTEALAGANQWSHKDSVPQKAVEAAKAIIRQGIGMNPNTLLVGSETHAALRSNPDVIERVKYAMAPERVEAANMQTLAAYFGVENYVVGESMKGEPGTFEHIWGKVAILAYTETSGLASMGSPSFGYTYRLKGYPYMEGPYRDNRIRSLVYPYVSEDTPVIVGKDAGYLFTAVVA